MKKRVQFLVFIAFLSSFYSCDNRQKLNPLSPSKVEHFDDTIVPIEYQGTLVQITGGEYKPFYGSNEAIVKVEPFLVEEHQVKNSDFLRFVKANPVWRKSVIKRIFADTSYLSGWVNDTVLPLNALPDAPITNISWFAAKAYAESVGKRLPTMDEWEFLAMADEKLLNARKEKSYSEAIVALYLIKDRQFHAVKQTAPNYWKVYNLFDLVWEWTDDFNSVLTTGDSREASYDNKGLFCAGGATSATDILNYAAFMRFGFRASLKATFCISNLGFRCAKDLNK